MLTQKTRRGGWPEPRRLLAFHYAEGYEQYRPMTGTTQAPALVYEVIEAIEPDEGENGSPVYEGRIFDAATREMIHEHPYQSTIPSALSSWWTRETELDAPDELLFGTT
jgi:hypothetical protein